MTIESTGTPVSSMRPLIISLTCVRGSMYTTHEAAAGRAETLNRVPHRKVIGTMTRLVNRVSLWVLLVSIPASIPKQENVNPATTTATSTSGSRDTSGEIR